MQELKKEMPFSHNYDEQMTEVKKMTYNCIVISRNIPDEVVERYRFSRYIIDPNRRRFHTVVRILAWVIKFIRILRRKVKNKSSQIVADIDEATFVSEDDIKNAERYIFQASTREVEHFMKVKQYSKYSKNKDGILMYTGRILPTDEVCAVQPMTSAMKDLAATTFCVPVIDKHSPIAYSIVSDIHWNDKTVKHSGNESVCSPVLRITS